MLGELYRTKHEASMKANRPRASRILNPVSSKSIRMPVTPAERRVLAAVSTLTATAFVLRLGGMFRDVLPGAGWLAAALGALHLLRVAAEHRRLDEWRPFLRTHAFHIGLFAACILALAARLPAYASDLGHTPLDIDERRVAANVRDFLLNGEVRHAHIEHYPGVVYWLFVGSSFLSFLRGLSHGLGAAVSIETVAAASRLANIWIACVTVALTALVGLRLAGPTAGLIGALLVAIAPIAVETSVLVRNDAGMVLAVMAAVYAALVYIEDRRPGWIAAAGAFAGLAAAIKYSAVFALVPVLAAALTGARTLRARASAAAAAALAFGVAVAATNHYIWTDFPNFLRQLADQHAFTGPGHSWGTTDNPAAMYLLTLGSAGPGWAMVALAAGFTAYALATRSAKLWIFVTFPMAYLWFMTQRPLQVARWVYPLVPFVAVAGAAALVAVVQWGARLAVRPALSWRALKVSAALAIAGVLWQPVQAGAVSFSRRINRPTHDLVEAWIREHADPGTVVLLGRGWLDPGDTSLVLRRVPNLARALDAGIEALGGCDWIVVPETVFGHPALRHLMLLRRFEADRSFGGNLGYDYEIYAVPEMFTGTACGEGS
jgi:4-amino-4-deoxy-L-arabinose transferase-like glycosyltransferase